LVSKYAIWQPRSRQPKSSLESKTINQSCVFPECFPLPKFNPLLTAGYTSQQSFKKSTDTTYINRLPYLETFAVGSRLASSVINHTFFKFSQSKKNSHEKNWPSQIYELSHQTHQ
jgi:hypothetical protein